jgi:KipI family sensor histidine kinase inhibitor
VNGGGPNSAGPNNGGPNGGGPADGGTLGDAEVGASAPGGPVEPSRTTEVSRGAADRGAAYRGVPYPVRPLGDRALIVDLADLAQVDAVRAELERTHPEGIDGIVPAARTVAVLLEPRKIAFDAARSWLERTLRSRGNDDGSTPSGGEERTLGRTGAHPRDGGATPVVLDVVYDGADLAETARLAGLSVGELVRRHQDATWRVAFGGFAPGFGYLVTDAEWPQVPRRDSPRTRVPAGSVALAGEFSSVYPREGPGGWQLIGRTDAPLWTPGASRPALLAPGTEVRFRAVRSPAAAAVAPVTATAPLTPLISSAPPVALVLTVVDAGMQLLVEDLGRPGFASFGAARSGALDRGALRLANRLVGNDEAAAGLEVLLSAQVRFHRAAWFAVTGARGALGLAGRRIEPDTPVHADAGDLLTLGAAEHGVRYYLAVRGGVDAPRELGSSATDIGSRLGPPPLAAGDPIALGDRVVGPIPAVDALTVWSPPDDEVDVRVVPGPRDEWFDPASVAAFYATAWRVGAQSNRVGVRLASQGVALARASAAPAELPSEPMVPGCIQVPPSGEPTVLLADGPVTGGYPVIAVVADADLDLFGQLRPGQAVRFRHARRH